MSNIVLVFLLIVISISIIVLFVKFVTNIFGNQRHINIMLISIKKMARKEYDINAHRYIKNTLRELGITLRYWYDDFSGNIILVEITHAEYGDLYYFRKQTDIEKVHKEYIQIYKDINDIFEEASTITSLDEFDQTTARLAQMTNYHRDTYQITKK